MRHFLAFLVFSVLALPTYAAENGNTSTLPSLIPQQQAQKLPETLVETMYDKDIEKAIIDGCKQSSASYYYDCACVADKNIDLRHKLEYDMDRRGLSAEEKKKKRIEQTQNMLTESYYACPNVPTITASNYGSCISWAALSRDDYRDFCQCYAVTYAEDFAANIRNLSTDSSRMRADAMIGCNDRLRRGTVR